MLILAMEAYRGNCCELVEGLGGAELVWGVVKREV